MNYSQPYRKVTTEEMTLFHISLLCKQPANDAPKDERTTSKTQRQKKKANSHHQYSGCDNNSFSFDHILKIIKNAHDSCLLNNELKEDTQAYEHLLEKCISILCVPNLSNSSIISSTSIGL